MRLTHSSYSRLARHTLRNSSFSNAARKATAFLLLSSLIACSLPTVVAASAVRSAVKLSTVLGSSAKGSLEYGTGLLTFPNRGGAGRTPRVPAPKGSRPVQQSREEREARVASLQLNPAGEVELQSGQPMQFSAIPLDFQGETVQGLSAEWESTNSKIVFVKRDGQAVAGKHGTAILTARAGAARESIRVTVNEGTREPFGGKKKENSHRSRIQARAMTTPAAVATLSRKLATKRHHSSASPATPEKQPLNARRFMALPLSPLRDPIDDPLPDDETGSLYQPANSVGAPPGKTRPGGLMPAVATEGTETGNKNFSFGLPIVNLPGRGISVSLDLTYNSLLYNKSKDPYDNSTWLTYDVDSGYPAPGFRLGYGQIEDQGSFGFTLTDADGTRHALTYTSANTYDANDGSFIRFVGGSGWGTLFYANGTTVTYGAAGTGGQRSYPTQITDNNGNYLKICYVGGVGPRISSVEDTMARRVRFYYDSSNGDLVTIKAPGLTGQADREVMRFYYDDLSYNAGTLFSSGVHVTLPSSSHVIKYVFLPSSTEASGAHIGYRFDYSAYGMIYQTVQFRGMTVSSTSTSSTGSVTAEGTQAAVSTYNYPGTPVNSTNGLSDLPSYTTRTDDWAGRTTGMNGNPATAPYYTFSVDEANGISTVTAPDGSISESDAIVHADQWDDGLIKETFVDKQGSSALVHTVTDWEQGAGNAPRPTQVRTTDETGQTKAVVFSYTSSYNNVAAISERDFTSDGSVSATELRRRETTYITSSSYINRRLIHLAEIVKVFPGGSSTPILRSDYAYDNYGTNHANLTGRSNLTKHEAAYDPFAPEEEVCVWDPELQELVCDYQSPYDPATDYRGNITTVTSYPDANSSSNTIAHSTTYDIAGNVVTTQVDCCQLKTFSYTDSPNTNTYAYQTSVTSGNPSGMNLTTSMTYDFNTGLVATSTDENSLVTTNYYNSDSLRLEHKTVPGGGASYLIYSDVLEADANGKYHYYVETQTKLDAPGGTARYIKSRRYFDGRDAVARTLDNFTAANGYSTQDVEYDVMGRAYRWSNPYYASGYSTAINLSGFWNSSTFDHLGRVTQVTTPRGDDNNALTTSAQMSFAGVFTTITDQAGRQRRQKVDALGRVVRLDEPDSSGNLGTTSVPTQATSYDYDALDNLVHVSQPGPSSTQHRYFKFDSLSRLIRERQVEQATNSSYNLSDPLTGNSAWSRKIDYNSSGLVTDGYDARGVHTQFSYDDLNRLSQITYSDATPAVHYYYDSQTLPGGAPSYTHGYSNGRVLATTYGSGTPITGTYYGYDAMGAVNVQKQVTGSATYSLSYSYNLAGLLTSETYPSGRALSHTYDEGGRLASIDDGTTTFATSLAYEAHGGLASETLGNQMVHALEYNKSLQTSKVKLSQTVNNVTTVLQQYDYRYGEFNTSTGAVDTSKNSGQIGSITGTINGSTQWLQGFRYDQLGRLSNVAEYQSGNMGSQTYSQSYTYDRFGNRFQSANSTLGLPAVSASEIDAATNRFIDSGSTPTSYDAAGNITTDTKFRGLKYEYDANGRQRAVKLLNETSVQTSIYDCVGQRVQTTDSTNTRTMVYDVFGQNVADYLGSGGNLLERENIYRGGQLLATAEIGVASAPTDLVATAASGNVTLTWSAASGAANYRVERKAAGGSYASVGTTATTSLSDSGGGSSSAYLYRVCSADGSGNCTSLYSNVVLGARLNFTTDPTLVGNSESPGNGTSVKAAHVTELRSAVNAVRSLAGLGAATWTHTTVSTGDPISKDDVNELRTKLNDALAALNLRLPTYIDHPLAGAPDGTSIRVVQIRQLRQCTTAGSSCYKPIAQFIKDFYQGVLHRQPTEGELSTWTATLSQAQAQGATQLIAAAQSLGSTLFNSTDYANLNTTNAQFVADLYTGYLQRTHDLSGYNFWLNELDNNGDTRAHQIQAFSVSSEFGDNAAALCAASATGGGLRYVLADVQGSTRAVMSNNGTASTIIARHDYLPFGEEIGAGLGLRTGGQGYSASDNNRHKYALTERDTITGLDHTWFRKYESLAGRWTSPDPYNGSMTVANPQSFNRYSYVQNDPVNFVDPSGLRLVEVCSWWAWFDVTDPEHPKQISDPFLRCNTYWVPDSPSGPVGGGEPPIGGGGPGGDRRFQHPQKKTPLTPDQKKAIHDMVKQNCLAARQSERQRNLEQGRSKRVGRAMAIGCAISGTGGAVAGGVGGGIVGIVTGPGEPLVGAAGAVVGGILGCTVGALTGGFGQLTIGEYLERRDARKDAATDNSECERQANAAVAGL